MLEKESAVAIGQSIKTHRNSAGLTQHQLGEKVNKTESTIRKYEAGDVLPPLDVIEIIAITLKTTPFDLVGASYWDLKIGEDGLKKLRDGANLIDVVEEQHGKQAAHAFRLFTELNPIGQEKALDYISDLMEQPKYRD